MWWFRVKQADNVSSHMQAKHGGLGLSVPLFNIYSKKAKQRELRISVT